MIEGIRGFKTPYGTMGDLIDATPKEVISQVYLEDMLFETWNYGRAVLIGDGRLTTRRITVSCACFYLLIRILFNLLYYGDTSR